MTPATITAEDVERLIETLHSIGDGWGADLPRHQTVEGMARKAASALRFLSAENARLRERLAEAERHSAPAPFDMEGALECEWQVLLDKDDRTSPEEYPGMVLISRDELYEAMHNAALPYLRGGAGTKEWGDCTPLEKAALDAWEALETTNDWFAQREAGEPTTNSEEAIFRRVHYAASKLEAVLMPAAPSPEPEEE